MADVFEQLEIRRYTPSDLEQAVRLNKEASISTGMGPESGDWAQDLAGIESDFLGSGGDFLVGRQGAELVVMGGFRRLSDQVAEIKRMRVTPRLQGQGIGRGFLGLLEEEIAEAEFETIFLSTTSGQVGAQRLYEGSGYTRIAQGEEGGLIVLSYSKKLSQYNLTPLMTGFEVRIQYIVICFCTVSKIEIVEETLSRLSCFLSSLLSLNGFSL